MTNHANIRVFVSSTSEDLKNYRAVARNVILDIGWHPIMMEHFGAVPIPTIEACCKRVDDSDVLLLIMAHRRGWVPTREQGGDSINSVTAFEIKRARDQKIPILALLADEKWPGNLWEDESDARIWVKTFRSELNLPAVFFESEPERIIGTERLPAFRAKVRDALLSHKSRLLDQQKTQTATTATDLDILRRAQEIILSGSDIPFLGMAIYNPGLLSPDTLAKAVAGEMFQEQTRSLATAAEYRERFLGTRELFLKHLEETLVEGIEQVREVPVFDLITQSNQISAKIIVSATYDNVLMRKLADTGKSFVVITHILRSFDGENDGKILMIREDGTTDICLADEVDLRNTELVIYKPLGSPFLHKNLDPDLEIDTVVVTETDHLLFLSRLENQHTQIPSAFIRQFQRRPLLFLGYPLDVWHYRLVMQVFQSAGTKRQDTSNLAVRIPGSSMEELAWKRLGADLIRMEPNSFSEKILAELE